MRTRLCTDSPDQIVFRLTITATAKEFEAMRDQIDSINAHPCTELKYALTDVLSQARKIYWAKEGE